MFDTSRCLGRPMVMAIKRDKVFVQNILYCVNFSTKPGFDSKLLTSVFINTWSSFVYCSTCVVMSSNIEFGNNTGSGDVMGGVLFVVVVVEVER